MSMAIIASAQFAAVILGHGFLGAASFDFSLGLVIVFIGWSHFRAGLSFDVPGTCLLIVLVFDESLWIRYRFA